MTGRGVDQILPHPSSPELHEGYLTDAREYVALAIAKNGPIARPVGFEYIWGEALTELKLRHPQVRIINLETSVTTSHRWEDKGINYRMHPENVPVLKIVETDVCVLANNHVLDWGRKGLSETLQTLTNAGIRTAGASENLHAARTPAVIDLPLRGRVLVFAWATESSGVPEPWAAEENKSGVNLLRDFSNESLQQVRDQVRSYKKKNDIAVFSIHWGGNWGYAIPPQHTQFARALVEEAEVDIVYGHSSHHVLGSEVHRGKLIIYGCGDFITDYEGIRGHENYRGDLPVMFFPTVEISTGKLRELRLVPMRLKNFRLQKADPEETNWLLRVLRMEGKKFGTSFELAPDRSLLMHWSGE